MKKLTGIILFVFLTITFLSSTAQIRINEDADAVRVFSDAKILIGDPNGELRLNDILTRAEFCKLLHESDIIDFTYLTKQRKKISFNDVSSNHWAYEYISKLSQYGLLKGTDENIFSPEKGIRLVDAERIVLRVLLQDDNDYQDTYVASKAVEHNLIVGISAQQLDKITRENAVKLLYNTISEKEHLASEYESSDEFLSSSKMSAGTSTAVSRGDSAGIAYVTSSEHALYEDAIDDYNNTVAENTFTPSIENFNTEDYSKLNENGFKDPMLSPLSTLSIDTDTASYSNMRRNILAGNIPPLGSIRTEELINYFTYNNKIPTSGEVFGMTSESIICPWNPENILTRISIQGEQISEMSRKPQNLVFLIDVSGSMYSQNKLPLVKRSMNLLLSKLDERDRISIVTYANGTSVALDGAKGNETEIIKETLNSLRAGGGTAGGAGLLLAYEQAEKFKVDGNNRIILCTDGDFNIGISSDAELKSLVDDKRKNNIYLSVIGVGTGNLKDNKLEIIADNGNGSYYYIDNLKEAKKVLSDEMTKTMYTIADDVKIQVEFNPAVVEEYRLIGYENRLLATEDFNNDEKDAGELNSGSSVTVLYEIKFGKPDLEKNNLRYSTTQYTDTDEIMCVNIRYKLPGYNESILRKYPIENNILDKAEGEIAFAAAVAELGMILNNSEYKGSSTYDSVISLAKSGLGEDKYGYRSEFIQLVDLLNLISKGY